MRIMRIQHKVLGSLPTNSIFGSRIKAIRRLLIAVIVYLEIFLFISSDGIEEYHPILVPNQQRWAVMMVGSGRSYMLTRNSFMQNVVHQTNNTMDIFTFTNQVSDTSCLVESESVRLLEYDSAVIHFDKTHLDLQGKNIWKISEDRLVRQHTEAFQMIDDYSKQTNIKYDFIFFTRPDLYYTVPFNIKEFEKKIFNSTDGSNSTFFSPDCCGWGGWCDQVAAAPYRDFARMIRASSEWISRGDDRMKDGTNPEKLIMARGQFANISKFDLRSGEDYGFFILRLNSAKEACVGNHDYVARSGSDLVCGRFAPFEYRTLGMCETLKFSNLCDVGAYAG